MRRGKRALDANSFDLIERNFVAASVIQLGRARAFICRDCLSLLNRAAVFQIVRDASCSEGMATGPGR